MTARLAILLAATVGTGVVAQRPAFRSTVDLILLNVTVTGTGGRYVSDLSADDFHVLEDGRPQEVAFFSPANVPVSVSLVLDTSSSLDEEMPLAKQVRRQVIVVLSDGEDTSSLVRFDQLPDTAKRSQTAVYAVGLGLEEMSPSLRPAVRSDGEFGLRQLADLLDVYMQIANELSNQYIVGYLSTNAGADGAWRRVAVRVNRPNLQARTRTGYDAATP